MKEFTRGIVINLLWLRTWLEIRRARVRGKKLVFILGTPIHINIGDLAIAYAEEHLIDSTDGVESIAIGLPIVLAKRSSLSHVVHENDVIMGHGGGNLGDTYPEEEEVRRFFINTFPNNKVIIFPQTIFFSDTPEGKEFKSRSQDIYSQHKNLTIIEREQVSHELARSVFPNNKHFLTPDIVLSLDVNETLPNVERSGVLTCLRDDEEKSLDNSDHQAIDAFARKVSKNIKNTDTISDVSFIMLRNKTKIVTNKLHEFRSAELVITDRLHGMVFAAITGTPCIVFSNFNHKVRGTYEWIKHLGYIKYCDSVKDMQNINVDDLKNNARDYDPSSLDEYWDKIRHLIKEGR